MAVVHSDPFTTDADQDLSAYDSAWVQWLGAPAVLQVVADDDRLECPAGSAEVDIGYMWTGLGSPTGDERITLLVHRDADVDWLGVAGRCAAGQGYVATISSAGNVQLFRVRSGGFTLLASGGAAGAVVTDLLSLTITGTDPVQLTVEWAGQQVIDIQDATALRLEAGLPGIQAFVKSTSDTAAPAWVDDWSVDDLQAGGTPQDLIGSTAIDAWQAASGGLSGAATLVGTAAVDAWGAGAGTLQPGVAALAGVAAVDGWIAAAGALAPGVMALHGAAAADPWVAAAGVLAGLSGPQLLTGTPAAGPWSAHAGQLAAVAQLVGTPAPGVWTPAAGQLGTTAVLHGAAGQDDWAAVGGRIAPGVVLLIGVPATGAWAATHGIVISGVLVAVDVLRFEMQISRRLELSPRLTRQEALRLGISRHVRLTAEG